VGSRQRQSNDLHSAFAIASRFAPSDIHRRRCRAIASRLAPGTSVLAAPDTNHRRGCFPTASDRPAGATVPAALGTTGSLRL